MLQRNILRPPCANCRGVDIRNQFGVSTRWEWMLRSVVFQRGAAYRLRASAAALNMYGVRTENHRSIITSRISSTYIHGAVRHTDGEYVRGEHHTNSVENFWEAFQKFGSLDPHSRERQAHGLVSERVHFPREPPPDVERDVRPFDFGRVTNRLMSESSFLRAAGPIPHASSCLTNSRRRPVFKALLRVSMGCGSTDSAPYSTARAAVTPLGG
jgi:hypothetical protein